MAQYIDKDVSVAEIERLKKAEGWCQVGKDTADVYYARGFRFACERIMSFFDTIEVKDVDLEKEFNDFLDNVEGVPPMWHSNEQIEWAKDIARHFYELGIMQSVNESIIRKIIDLNDEAAKHYDAIIKKENEENGFSQLAIDLFERKVDAKELCIQYVIENLQAQKGE